MFGFRKKVSEPVSINAAKIDELLTRGVDRVVDKGTLRSMLMAGKKLRIKLGIDPTSPHIHLGRATQLLKLRDFQELGHTVVFIIGDATGVVGDTSDKDAERPMLTSETTATNAKNYLSDVGKVIDMSRAEVYRNGKWLNKLTYTDIGKQAGAFSVSDFIARDNIAKRLTEGKRVSLREVLYPLMQGYDSVAIRADVEIGGSDQWFNLLAGRTLQELYGQKPQNILTNKLIRGTDGRKMSSSWGNVITLGSAPSDMYGKVMSLHDDCLEEYFINCTRVPLSEVKVLMQTNDPKRAKMRLAKEIVILYHGANAAKEAEDTFVSTFGKGTMPKEAKAATVTSKDTLVDVLVTHGVVSSKSELHRLIKEGAVTNMTSEEKITDPHMTFEKDADLKVGKRRFIKIRVR